MKRSIKLRPAASAVVLSALLIGPVPTAAGPLDSYIEGAKKEGAVRIGVTLRKESHGKPAGEKYLAAFQKRYPFLKVDFKRIGGGRERERVISELTAGVVNFDVATVSETMVGTLLDAKLARILDWAKLGAAKQMVHPKNVGVSMRTPVYGIGYNRDLIPDATAASFTWETCTDPKWKGKTVTDNRPRHLEVLYEENGWGREKTLDYARRWAANKPIMEPSRSTAAQKLAVGAFDMVCGMPRRQVADLREFAGVKSLGIVFPEPVPVGVGDIIYVPQKAKHSNAAALFLIWSTTQEAQTLLDDVDFSGHPSFGGNDINKVIKGKKVAYSGWEHSARSDDILAEILQAMGFPVVR